MPYVRIFPSQQDEGRNLRVTVSHALQAGARAYVAFLLLLAFLATPAVAGHLDFGHEHPEETTGHVHALDTILPGAVAIPTLRIEPETPSCRRSLPLPSTGSVSPRWIAANGIRAPPHF